MTKMSEPLETADSIMRKVNTAKSRGEKFIEAPKEVIQYFMGPDYAEDHCLISGIIVCEMGKALSVAKKLGHPMTAEEFNFPKQKL